jgi:hypothetical protein
MSTFTNDFIELYRTLMKNKFMSEATPIFGKTPTLKRVHDLIVAGEPHLPVPFRAGYTTPLLERLDSVFARLDFKNPRSALFLEALSGAVYQHEVKSQLPALNRFLAVISDLYRSFLDSTKREHLNVPLTGVLPPLAVFQSSPQNGPFTIPIDQVNGLIGADIGVVSLPATLANHPFLFGSLAHETGGHDVLHADVKLLPELRDQAHSLLGGMGAGKAGLLWDYWMDEAASDVYGVLNMGPAFGANLTALLAVFIAQTEKRGAPLPILRTQSGSAPDGSLDSHPTDILRLSLVQGAISALVGLSKPTKDRYIAELDELATLCAPGASSIELAGFARISVGKSVDFDESLPISDLRQSARLIGAHIATASLDALDGHSIQAIETWNDADEAAASGIATLLRANKSIVNGGDDAQILAGLTLALLDQPYKYAAFSKLATEALDDSFRRDPYWGMPEPDSFILRTSRPVPKTTTPIDPYAALIIDYNPLEGDVTGLGMGPEIVTLHAIDAIPWPDASSRPKAAPLNPTPAPDASLPKADIALITWTAAEANAMSMVLTPNYLAMPPSSHVGNNVWYPYTHKYKDYISKLRPGSSPALQSRNLGKYFMSEIGSQKVLCFKSSLHLARDMETLPVRDLFKQIAAETGAKLIVTTGTAGAIGPRLILGDAVIASQVCFDCMRMLKDADFNNKTYTSKYNLAADAKIALANRKLIPANVSHLPSLPRSPRIYTGTTVLGGPNIVVTTDIFAYDDSTDHYHLQGKGSMVEMDDAVLALACEDLGDSAPAWLAIRNASDPQVGPNLTKADAAKIYEDYGYWTSLTSVLACWAVVTSYDLKPPALNGARARGASKGGKA